MSELSGFFLTSLDCLGTLISPPGTKAKTLNESWDIQSERTEYLREYLSHLVEKGIDIIISPVAPWASTLHNHNNDVS